MCTIASQNFLKLIVMKKLSLILGVVALTFATTSCKKEYTCECAWEEEHGDHHHDEKESFTLGKVKKKDAESACDTRKATIAADEHNHDIECKTVAK